MLTLFIVVVALTMISKLGAIILGAYLLCRAFSWFYRQNPQLALRLVGAAVLVGIIATLGILQVQRAKNEARAEATAEAQQRRRDAARQASEEKARAAETERESREDLLLRWHAARRTAIRHWREDLIDARAVGDLGVSPPMLSVQDGGWLLNVTNKTQNTACVLITRVAIRDSAVLSRCTVGSDRCVIIHGGATARWATLRTGNPESCLTGTLEFRVGNVDHPDPSWWSQSALDAFGGDDPGNDSANRWSDAALIAEITRLEERIADRLNVER